MKNEINKKIKDFEKIIKKPTFEYQHSIKNLYLILNQNYLIMYLKDSKTVVIKIGSSLLINDKKIVREKWLIRICKRYSISQKIKKKYYFSKFRSNCSWL